MFEIHYLFWNILGGIFFPLLVLMIVWEFVWKLIAMWKAARKDSPIWFVVLAIVNSLGILSILYIYVFSEMKSKRTVRKRKR